MKVGIIDYGMGNVFSVKNAFLHLGASVVVSSDWQVLQNSSHLILPGVGSFADGMKNLNELDLVQPLKEHLVHKKACLLGICLGMQLLADEGEEGGCTAGLSLIPGPVKKMQTQHSERLPHLGWNQVEWSQENALLNGIDSKTDFYFAHSYHFEAQDAFVIARTPYCGEFVSIVTKENVVGTQFHPEKSSKAGLRLLQNFLERTPSC
ncbi:MAG: imidazole glycerol phosphate synthase subunit HisH [Deltaproteobacteria bacterium]|nr:imidazole glycerol phosphate synthase subunit HisH [Deltaproteobacteria bacterium]